MNGNIILKIKDRREKKNGYLYLFYNRPIIPATKIKIPAMSPNGKEHKNPSIIPHIPIININNPVNGIPRRDDPKQLIRTINPTSSISRPQIIPPALKLIKLKTAKIKKIIAPTPAKSFTNPGFETWSLLLLVILFTYFFLLIEVFLYNTSLLI